MYNNYIIVDAFIINNEIIPLWDIRVGFEEDEMYGKSYTYEGKRNTDIQKVFLNVTTKELTCGEIIEIFNTDTNFTKGEAAFVEVDYSINKIHKQIRPCTIGEVKKGRETSIITGLGSTLSDYYHYINNPIGSKLYCLKFYQPSYILEDGEVVEWDYKLFKSTS